MKFNKNDKSKYIAMVLIFGFLTKNVEASQGNIPVVEMPTIDAQQQPEENRGSFISWIWGGISRWWNRGEAVTNRIEETENDNENNNETPVVNEEVNLNQEDKIEETENLPHQDNTRKVSFDFSSTTETKNGVKGRKEGEEDEDEADDNILEPTNSMDLSIFSTSISTTNDKSDKEDSE